MSDPIYNLAYEAMRFFVWAAGEGICPVEGEPAVSPEEALCEFACASGDENYDGYADRLRSQIATLTRERDEALAERDELDFILHEGGTWEQQLASAEAQAIEAEKVLAELVDRDVSYHGGEVRLTFEDHGEAISAVARARLAIRSLSTDKEGT